MNSINYGMNTNSVYRVSRSVADFLKKPFYNWRSHGSSLSFALAIIFKAPVMIAGLLSSLPFRKLSIWFAPNEGHVVTKTNAPAKKVANKVDVLSYNILGMPSYHAAKEKRAGINERLEAVFKVIREANADVVLLQEVHAGSNLEKRIIKEFMNEYNTIYHDMGPKAFFLGSGLMVLTKFENTEFSFVPFEKSAEIPTKKGFGVLTVKDSDNKSVVRIADTHLQSGSGIASQNIRTAQAQQIVDYANANSDVSFFFGGDLNVDRQTNDEYTSEHPFHHDNKYIQDGFEGEAKREEPTLADFEGSSATPSYKAVDNILGINSEGWKLESSFLGTFDDKEESPSDHAAVLSVLKK